jgi:hypothetical protein
MSGIEGPATAKIAAWGLVIIALTGLVAATWLAAMPQGRVVYSPQIMLAVLNLFVAALIAWFTDYRERATVGRRQRVVALLVDRELVHLRRQLLTLSRPGRPRIGEFAFPAVRQGLDATIEVKPELRERLASFVNVLTIVETLLERCLANPGAILLRRDLQRVAERALRELEQWLPSNGGSADGDEVDNA